MITEHRRPIAEVHQTGTPDIEFTPAEQPFSLADVTIPDPVPGLATALIDEDRGAG